MTGGRRPWLGLLLVLLTPTVTLSVTHPQEALQALDGCVQRLNPGSDTGYDRIAVRCPNLARQLNESGVSVWLPHGWQRPGNDLSARGLRDLRGLLERELTPNPRPVSFPAIERVPAVLASLEREDPERSGWWARTRKWLRCLFEAPAPDSEESWLNQMIGQGGLSQAVIELVSYGALLIVVLMAIAIVANELHVSGALRRRLATLRDTPVGPSKEQLSWEDVQKADRPRRPGLLLEVLAARLTKAPRGLTARELERVARLASEEDRRLLVRLVETAERLKFSNTEVPEETLEQALAGGRLLLERVPVS